MARGNFKGCSLSYKVYKDELFEGGGWPNADKYSVTASAYRYSELLEKRLRKAFPGANVEVDVENGSGYGSNASAICDFDRAPASPIGPSRSDAIVAAGRLERDLADNASEIAGRLYVSHRSWVRRK